MSHNQIHVEIYVYVENKKYRKSEHEQVCHDVMTQFFKNLIVIWV